MLLMYQNQCCISPVWQHQQSESVYAFNIICKNQFLSQHVSLCTQLKNKVCHQRSYITPKPVYVTKALFKFLSIKLLFTDVQILDIHVHSPIL